jgi:hypothetical protein
MVEGPNEASLDLARDWLTLSYAEVLCQQIPTAILAASMNAHNSLCRQTPLAAGVKSSRLVIRPSEV